jgi:hypothetical protein
VDWDRFLEAGERLLWSGRPAPRCYTFRNWKHALVGLLLLLLGLWWQAVGLQLAAVYQLPILVWIPLPVCLGGLYLGLGQVLKSRLEWEHLFYAVTDRRLLCCRGRNPDVRQLPFDAVSHFRLKPYAAELSSLAIYAGSTEQRLDFKCIEHPRIVTDLLEQRMRRNGVLAPKSD